MRQVFNAGIGVAKIILDAVRSLLKKMNIRVVEADKIRNKSVCCGDSAWGTLPADKVKLKMRKRAGQMPENNVVVTCVSCIKSMHVGGNPPPASGGSSFRRTDTDRCL